MKTLKLYVDFQSRKIKTNNQNDNWFCSFYEAGIGKEILCYDDFLSNDLDNHFFENTNIKLEAENIPNFEEVETIEVDICKDGQSFEISTSHYVPCDNTIIEMVLEDYTTEDIVRMAWNEYTEGFRSVVAINKNDYSIETFTLSSNTGLSEDYIIIYELEQNWINNNNWNELDILNDDEVEKLKEIVGEDDYIVGQHDHDIELLEKIGVDYNDRIVNYLTWIVNDYSNSSILELALENNRLEEE